jgi:hypothetical protein
VTVAISWSEASFASQLGPRSSDSGPDIDYDPVCFDLNKRSPDGDCAIVKVDHEEALSHERFRIVAVLADSFRELVQQTIASRNM